MYIEVIIGFIVIVVLSFIVGVIAYLYNRVRFHRDFYNSLFWGVILGVGLFTLIMLAMLILAYFKPV